MLLCFGAEGGPGCVFECERERLKITLPIANYEVQVKRSVNHISVEL